MRLALATDKIDDSFNVSSDGSSTVVSTLVQPDGKNSSRRAFLNDYDNLNITHLIRLNSDGSFDSGFNAAAYADANICAVRLQKDGKILAADLPLGTNGIPSSYLSRLNPDGSSDASFRAATIPGTALWSMAIQADGTIVVGGFNNTNQQSPPVSGPFKFRRHPG